MFGSRRRHLELKEREELELRIILKVVCLILNLTVQIL
jgi:hypothetical protein